MKKSITTVATAALALALVAAACGSSSKPSATTTAGITVTSPWAYSTADVATTGVVYLGLRNAGATDDALVGARVPASVAKTVELHQTVATPGSTMDGAMGMGASTTTTPASALQMMNPVDRIAVPAGATVTLQPGGYHLMLMDLAKPLRAGETVAVTLTFEHAPPVTVQAAVRATRPQ